MEGTKRMQGSSFCRIGITVLAALLALSILEGCEGEEEVKGTPLVKVNGSVITKEDVDRAWLNLPEHERVKYLDRQGRQALVNNMVSLELLHQEALRQKLDRDPDIQRKTRKAEQNILVDTLISKSIQPADLYRMYQENFIRARHIKISVHPPTDPDQDLKASHKINMVYSRVKKGEKFEDMAREHSQGMNSQKGGDLGYFTRKTALDRFGFDAQEALFSLKEVDQFSAPARGKDGYYIFQLTEAKGNLDPNGFTESLGNMLFLEKSEEIYRGYVNELKSHALIENHKENLGSFLSIGGPKGPPETGTDQGSTVTTDD